MTKEREKAGAGRTRSIDTRSRRYVAVIGSGACSEDEYRLAREVGRGIAKIDAVLVCGGGAGVMEAAALGTREAGGTTLGILPGHDRARGNRYLDICVTTGIGHARNLAVVSTGDVVIAVGGEYGTLSEIGLAAKIGRPVILLRSWKVEREGFRDGRLPARPSDEHAPIGLFFASSATEAIAQARQILDSSGLSSAPSQQTAGEGSVQQPRKA